MASSAHIALRFLIYNTMARGLVVLRVTAKLQADLLTLLGPTHIILYYPFKPHNNSMRLLEALPLFYR